MGLLIGGFLVYHFQLHWICYVVCVLVTLSEWDMHYKHRRALEIRIQELEAALLANDRQS
jgi:hypothetical protein